MSYRTSLFAFAFAAAVGLFFTSAAWADHTPDCEDPLSYNIDCSHDPSGNICTDDPDCQTAGFSSGNDSTTWPTFGSPGACDLSRTPPAGTSLPAFTCTVPVGGGGTALCNHPTDVGTATQTGATHTYSGTVLCGQTDASGAFVTDAVAWYTMSGTTTDITVTCTEASPDQCVHELIYNGGGDVNLTLTHDATLDDNVPGEFCSSTPPDPCTPTVPATLTGSDPSGLSKGQIKNVWPSDGDLVAGQLLRFVEEAVLVGTVLTNSPGQYDLRYCQSGAC